MYTVVYSQGFAYGEKKNKKLNQYLINHQTQNMTEYQLKPL